jgi:hypothetical protein
MFSRFSRSMCVLLLLLVCAPAAYGQARLEGGALPVPAAALQPPLPLPPAASAPHPIDPGYLLRDRLARDAVEARLSRRTYYVAGGAVIGAAIGVAVLFAPRDCRTAEAMCGIAIPFYAGAGALGGALIGYVIGASTR